MKAGRQERGTERGTERETDFTQEIIAERLSVRHIIVRARRALMGPYFEVVLVCMYVCMSVRNGFTTEVYEFICNL